MPTNQSEKRQRFIAAGYFNEESGYVVDRPAGCHDWLLIYSVGGRGLFSFSDDCLTVQKHDAVLIAPNISHRYEVAPQTDRWELLWAHFLPPASWKSWLKWKMPTCDWGHLKVKSRVRRTQVVQQFRDVVSVTAGYSYHREALAMNSLEAVLLHCHEQVIAGQNTGLDSRIADVLEFICRRIDQPLGIPELALHTNLSPSRFSHLFREEMDMTPVEFVEQQRLSKARELLEHTGYSITAIATQVGFESPFYFSRRFKRAVGISPRDYRRAKCQ